MGYIDPLPTTNKTWDDMKGQIDALHAHCQSDKLDPGFKLAEKYLNGIILAAENKEDLTTLKNDYIALNDFKIKNDIPFSPKIMKRVQQKNPNDPQSVNDAIKEVTEQYFDTIVSQNISAVRSTYLDYQATYDNTGYFGSREKLTSVEKNVRETDKKFADVFEDDAQDEGHGLLEECSTLSPVEHQDPPISLDNSLSNNLWSPGL